ncbi:MAG TPA: von Willebrand factor type A domain-containing protein [Candidatus Limnocylindrales bacterium]|nr:von Willebrand factor type A domain-containing protein [Candidatus Limnocylindrales bacterium]
MRTPLLCLILAATLVTACSGSPGSGASQAAAPPDHHRSTAAPWRPAPTPYDGVTYENPGINPDVDPDEDRVSTFALDVDTASYTIAQRYVGDGHWPDPASVRVEEWVNAFDQGYRRPTDRTFAIVADGGPTPFTDRDELLLRVGLQARDVRAGARADAALTFVIDTSGSMEREGRLELVKDALRILVEGLGPDDTVALVTFGDDGRVVLGPTPAHQRHDIDAAIDDLRPGGSTNLEAGLRLGYGLARETLTENGIDRVVLASDGVANIGLTDPQSLLATIRDDAAAGIELVSVGVGMGNYNDVLLERLADQGDGFYAYVNSLDEARRLFTEDLTGTLQTVALDARAQVEFEPDVVASYRLVGYEDRAVADEDFTDEAIDAGAIGAGHAVTALYAIRLREDVGPQGRLATVRVRWVDPERGSTEELARDVRTSDLARSFADADPIFRLDAVVAATADILRGGPSGARFRLDDVAVAIDDGVGRLPDTDDARAFLDLVDRLARMDH